MDVEATQLSSLAFDCPRLPQIHAIPPNSVTSPVARMCFISLLSAMEVALFLCDAVVLFLKNHFFHDQLMHGINMHKPPMAAEHRFDFFLNVKNIVESH